MIFYSIIPLEFVMQEDSTSANTYITKIINYNNCQVEVMQFSNGITKIRRIISTSLKDYLDPKLEPGTIINNNF